MTPPESRGPAGPTGRAILAVLVVGASVRLALLYRPLLWYDEATTGIMGLAVLRGELPVYFFGQPFMGALDAYLTAPFFVTLGVSARSLELVAVVVTLAWMALTVRLAWEAFGPRAALLAAVVIALPPDYLVRWSHEARPHYTLAMTLGTLALLLALRTPTVESRRAPLHFGLLGGILGLAFWTNFLSVVYVPAVAVLVLWRLRGRLLPALLVGVPGFALGSLPHWLYGLRHGTALPPPGGRIGGAELLAHLEALGRGAWPILAGVPAPLRGTTRGGLLGLALAVVYALTLLGVLRRVREGATAARALRLALVVLVAANLGVAVGTPYGRFLTDDARYLLPLYTALPILVGHGLARLRSAALAAALAVALLAIHAADATSGDFRSFAPAVVAEARGQVEAQQATIAALERDGPQRLYAPDFTTRVLVFLSGERVVLTSHYEEIYPRYALLVDGADTVGWWFAGRFKAFEATLTALGARFAHRRAGPLGDVYVDFSVPSRALRELEPAGFGITASEEARRAGWIADRDAHTVWRTGRPMQGGEWVQVDLGRPEPVALLRWLPGKHQETPRGLVLEASLDGQRWDRLVDVPSYFGPLYWSAGRPMGRVRNGRVELRVGPTPARYLRITQTGRDGLWPWSIRELFVYAAAADPAGAAPAVESATLARALRHTGVVRLYADHGWGSRVALADPAIRILPANVSVDAYGFTGPPAEFLPRFRWGRGSGVVLETVDAESFEAAMRLSGLSFSRQRVEGLELFSYAPPVVEPGTRLPASALRVSASRRGEEAARAVDGDPVSRWGTGLPQGPGDWFQVDLAPPRSVRAVRLWTAHPTDWPRGLRLEGSEDGASWRPLAAVIRTEGRHIWGGIALLRDGVETVRVDFEPATLRALRLVLTRGDGVFDWSIHELTVFSD